MRRIFIRGRGRRLPLPDELPYHFYPPRVSPLWFRIIGMHARYLLNRIHGVRSVEFSGVDQIKRLVGRGDGILLTPNHPSGADCWVIFELSRQIDQPFCYMAAYQIFFDVFGYRRFILPRLGVFPVDREGSDRAAYKTGLDILLRGRNPLVIFPEGEIYHLADRLTPLREGAAAMAIAATKKCVPEGKTIWVVPVAIKYRFLDGHDLLTALGHLMDELESFFTWSIRRDRPFVERLYRYAEAILALKEYEYLGSAQTGPLKERIADLTHRILDEIENRRIGRRVNEDTPVRIKQLRRACLAALKQPTLTSEEKDQIRRDFDALFVCMQLFSYPGDYVREDPTVERLAEILAKFEMDILGLEQPSPRGSRRAIVRLGKPINVGEFLASENRSRARDAAAHLTDELEVFIQRLLDEIEPGHRLPPEAIPLGATPMGAKG